MNIIPHIIAILAGIVYGAVRTYFQDKKENHTKKRSNPYLESIVVCLVVYLLISTLFFAQ